MVLISYQKYHVWKHDASGETLVRTTSYSLPERLHDHVDVVQPTTMFSLFKPMRTAYHTFRPNIVITENDGSKIAVASASGGQVAASCNGTITPECLLELYNATTYTPQAAGKNKIAVTGYLEQYANYADYHQFLEELVPDAATSNFTTVYINGEICVSGWSVPGVDLHLFLRWPEQPNLLRSWS